MKNALGSFLLAATLLGTAGGCVVGARGHVSAPPLVVEVEVEEHPPQHRVVIMETRPGFIFVQGRWYRRGGRWEWGEGHWERERAGQVWVAGRWERRGNRHVWVEGSWRAGGGPVVRDHRSPPPAAPPPAAPPADPIVRDHRH